MPRGRSPPSHSRTTAGSAWGNQTLELRYDGENHARGNIYIYAPAQKLLVLIDVVFPPAGSPSRTWPSAATSPAGSRRTTRRLTSRTMSAGTWGGPARAPTCWCRRSTCRTCELQASARPHGGG